MTNSKSHLYHEDSDLFREALSFTQSETGFSARLIEKDYFCTLLLEDMFSIEGQGCVFKGGTCLSKVHNEFYRMSEDLDFAISVPIDVARSQRSKAVTAMKGHLEKLPKRLPYLTVLEHLRGFNNSTQYIGQLSYRSHITGQDESIKIEISIREPILEPVALLPARTLLIDPFRQNPVINPFAVPAMSCRESYAEKVRAALTRREPAIRDFYDIDHGIRTGKLSLEDPKLIKLIQAKLDVPGNDLVDMSDNKLNILTKQVQAQLRPVLRESDFAAFDIDRAFHLVAQLATALPGHGRR
jgi:predicted nucleotidyltransferase component of viral defense system